MSAERDSLDLVIKEEGTSLARVTPGPAKRGHNDRRPRGAGAPVACLLYRLGASGVR